MLTGNSGIITQANRASYETKKSNYKEQIKLEYLGLKDSDETNSKSTKEIFGMLKENLNFKDAKYSIGSKSVVINIEDKYMFTLLEDGNLLDGRFAYLDIADGSIDIKANGYIQGTLERANSGAYNMTGDLIEYTGEYIISGTSTENVVRIWEEGTYNITIKDLNIDVSNKDNLCAFNANRGEKTNNCYVNIEIKGENYLCGGGSAAALGFSKATPNVNGETTGSTLTIQGDGYLEAVGGGFAAGIGSGYNGWEAAPGDANNIIINSGNIVAKATQNGSAIGGGLYKNVNNIIINGGNIEASSDLRAGIGAGRASANNIIINGGNIIAKGGVYAPAIGGEYSSDKLAINGGVIRASVADRKTSPISAIGHKCSSLEISSGTIIAKSNFSAGISCDTAGTIKITGGSILSTGTFSIGKFDESSVIVENSATDGTNNLYLTPIQLGDVTEEIKINSITTNDNINYGITDMYTSEDGILYLYLPEGEKTITIEANGKEYTGTVTTSGTNSVVVLNQK